MGKSGRKRNTLVFWLASALFLCSQVFGWVNREEGGNPEAKANNLNKNTPEMLQIIM